MIRGTRPSSALSLMLLLAVAAAGCADAPPPGSGTSGTASESDVPAIVAACGGVRFSTLPPDPSVLPPFDGWADVDLSEIGTEAEFFDLFDWFVAEETVTTLHLFGQPRSSERPQDLYASAGFTSEDGTWSPTGWGDCRIELSADGWGNARFVLDPAAPVDRNSSTIPVLATETNCASGEPPTDRDVRAVVLEETPETISIVMLVEPVEGGADCQGNPPFPYEVEVGSPLGDRHVLDASVYPPADVGVPSTTSPGPTGEPSPGTTPPGTPTGPTHPTPDPGVPLGASEDRLPILLAVLNSIVNDEGVPLYVNSQLCLDDLTAKNCPDRLNEDEQAAIQAAFPKREVHFIEGTDVGGDRVFEGEAQVAWLGPPMVADGRIQVVGSEVCGGLCGHGSVWLVEEKNGEWEVTGTAPGYGSWIA